MYEHMLHQLLSDVLQGSAIQNDCSTSALPADDGSWDTTDPASSPANNAAIQKCGNDLIAIVGVCPDGSVPTDLSCKGTLMLAAYNGLLALQSLQRHSLTSSTTVGGMRQLFTHLST